MGAAQGGARGPGRRGGRAARLAALAGLRRRAGAARRDAGAGARGGRRQAQGFAVPRRARATATGSSCRTDGCRRASSAGGGPRRTTPAGSGRSCSASGTSSRPAAGSRCCASSAGSARGWRPPTRATCWRCWRRTPGRPRRSGCRRCPRVDADRHPLARAPRRRGRPAHRAQRERPDPAAGVPRRPGGRRPGHGHSRVALPGPTARQRAADRGTVGAWHARPRPTTVPTPPVEVDGRRIVLRNLDKVLYPATGTTKGEVLAYYTAVAAPLLAARQGPAGSPASAGPKASTGSCSSRRTCRPGHRRGCGT